MDCIRVVCLCVLSRIKTTGVGLPRLDGATPAGFGRWRAWGEVRPGRSRQTAAFCGRSSCPAAAGASYASLRGWPSHCAQFPTPCILQRSPAGGAWNSRSPSASPFEPTVLGLPRAPAFTNRLWISEPPATTPAVGFRVRAGPGWLPWCRSSAQVFKAKQAAVRPTSDMATVSEIVRRPGSCRWLGEVVGCPCPCSVSCR